MQVFRDNRKRLWTVTINVAAVERVRGVVGVDLIEAVAGNLIPRLAADPALVANVLYALCLDQADRRGVTDSAFGRALVGERVLTDAAAALKDELFAFFPAPRPGSKPTRASVKPLTAVQIHEMIWQAAGRAGVDPGPLTMRQIQDLADAAGSDAWRRTSSVLAMLFNAHRDPKNSQPAAPDDFSPFARADRQEAKLSVPPAVANRLMRQSIKMIRRRKETRP